MATVRRPATFEPRRKSSGPLSKPSGLAPTGSPRSKNRYWLRKLCVHARTSAAPEQGSRRLQDPGSALPRVSQHAAFLVFRPLATGSQIFLPRVSGDRAQETCAKAAMLTIASGTGHRQRCPGPTGPVRPFARARRRRWSGPRKPSADSRRARSGCRHAPRQTAQPP